MKVFVSVATTADGYLDDTSDKRLIISSTEDWADVHRLRARYDAILVGAETLRKDNPSLTIKDEQLREERILRDHNPDIIKVTITDTGNLQSDMRFFTTGKAEKIVFSSTGRADHLSSVATIIPIERISAKAIVTELEKRGVERLFVEGGSKTLKMFFDEDMVDTFRLAINANIRVGCKDAPKLNIGTKYKNSPCVHEDLGGTEVTTYEIHPNIESEDIKYMRLAIEVSRECTPCQSSYCVGAVIVTLAGDLFTGYTHETSATHHAEQEAIAKALCAGASLQGATIYSSMEPCSARKSEPKSCSELILQYGFSDVVFALFEPKCFADCNAALRLREQGVRVRVVSSLADEVLHINSHICR